MPDSQIVPEKKNWLVEFKCRLNKYLRILIDFQGVQESAARNAKSILPIVRANDPICKGCPFFPTGDCNFVEIGFWPTELTQASFLRAIGTSPEEMIVNYRNGKNGGSGKVSEP